MKEKVNRSTVPDSESFSLNKVHEVKTKILLKNSLLTRDSKTNSVVTLTTVNQINTKLQIQSQCVYSNDFSKIRKDLL